ncbi:hypothetical protein A3I18_01505 [Candidatus Campbellbacteria bacterium RIFCSPLOWO2_02_FULL_35_11]|uniref:PilN domain-containing protein n=2 Tax=Candidatus Campbelliibacteriota TaxID=1752727 RepID=A0A1F5EN40_9BACT|nr:MAG: hypothetical protein A3E89_00710 [Candidatus Campbellbacteria bacterium RIFCSPHIGHO2_12_FULL_35_10]OGD70451.1 MAG: hypothetical protein A3I18_01505 [Candidatus Campbellbacteria bacterium RIFCSPLOWO2_02_FULL_35_11]
MVIGSDNTSFIPKKSPVVEERIQKRRTIDLFFLISMVIFLITLAFAMGVFLYENYLTGSIEESKIMLEKEKENFDMETIRQLIKLDNRLRVAEMLLGGHIDMTGLFDAIEESTLQAVQFVDFEFKITNEGIELAMDGITRDYSTVALQADKIGKNPFIKNIIFSDLDVNNEGKVIFSLTANVDPDLISFKKRVQN